MQHIIAAVASKERGMLERFWAELNYQAYVCRMTRSSHAEGF
jgi:hypothetical protein